MALTKRDVIKLAYREIGFADYEFDLSPDDVQAGLQVLDAMLAEWSVMGIKLGWAGGDGFGEVDANTEVPAWAARALYLNLAVELASGEGRDAKPRTQASAKASKVALMTRTVGIPERALIGYGGAGRRYYDYSGTMPTPADPIDTGRDGELELNG